MSNVVKIEVNVRNDTLGDTSDADCDKFRQWLTTQLRSEYPSASVSVGTSHYTMYIELDDGSDPVDARLDVCEYVGRCWDNCPWDEVAP